MYVVSVTLLLLVLPLVSIAAEMMLAPGAGGLMPLIGKWFTFWGVGVRHVLADAMQTFRPQFTAKEIFGIADPASWAIVREVGFANLAIGMLAIASFFLPGWRVPAALVAGLYLGFAGIGHAIRAVRNLKEQFAMVTDFALALLLLAFVASSMV